MITMNTISASNHYQNCRQHQPKSLTSSQTYHHYFGYYYNDHIVADIPHFHQLTSITFISTTQSARPPTSPHIHHHYYNHHLTSWPSHYHMDTLTLTISTIEPYLTLAHCRCLTFYTLTTIATWIHKTTPWNCKNKIGKECFLLVQFGSAEFSWIQI